MNFVDTIMAFSKTLGQTKNANHWKLMIQETSWTGEHEASIIAIVLEKFCWNRRILKESSFEYSVQTSKNAQFSRAMDKCLTSAEKIKHNWSFHKTIQIWSICD